MTGVLFISKLKWLAIKIAYVVAICTILFRSVEATFHETLMNYVDIVMTNEHGPLKNLINMLLSFPCEVLQIR